MTVRRAMVVARVAARMHMATAVSRATMVVSDAGAGVEAGADAANDGADWTI